MKAIAIITLFVLPALGSGLLLHNKSSSLATIGSVSTASKYRQTSQSPKLGLISEAAYRRQCSTKVTRAGKQLPQRHWGNQSTETVYKDGFYLVDCIKDELYYKGDKTGDHKHAYTLGTSLGNLNIAQYKEIVPKEDQETMTVKVCFEFCRTVQGMVYFGLIHGRECYCEPFMASMASDSSECDETCEGGPENMCGGKTKSSIFEMHLCDDTQSKLDEAANATLTASADLMDLAVKADRTGIGMQAQGEKLQKVFGLAGDPVAADLHQTAKEFSGEVKHAAEAAVKFAQKMHDTVTGPTFSTAWGTDFRNVDNLLAAETLTKEMNEMLRVADETMKSLTVLYEQASPPFPGQGRGAEYYSVMYFVDKEFVRYPTTCGGKAAGRPIYNRTYDECAAACDAAVHDCTGFSYFPGLCYLLKDFKSTTFYTKCEKQGNAQGTLSNISNLQLEETREEQALDFMNAEIISNNLGGKGPNNGDPEELRYGGIAQGESGPIDLVVTTTSPYDPERTDLNGFGPSHKFGRIDLDGCESKTKDWDNGKTECNNIDLKFRFEHSETREAATLPMFQLSLLDIDQQKNSDQYGVESDTITGFMSKVLPANPTYTEESVAGGVKLTSTRESQDVPHDNLDPLALTDKQQAASAEFTFEDVSEFKISFATTYTKTSRYLFFGGLSNLPGERPEPPTTWTPTTSTTATTTVPQFVTMVGTTTTTTIAQGSWEAPTFSGPIMCVAKLEDYEGTTLRPDPMGRCTVCMNKLNRADRCFKDHAGGDDFIADN